VALRSQANVTARRAVSSVVPHPRRIVASPSTREARRSESEKGLDEALRVRPGLAEVSMAMGRRAVAGDQLRAPGGALARSFLSSDVPGRR